MTAGERDDGRVAGREPPSPPRAKERALQRRNLAGSES